MKRDTNHISSKRLQRIEAAAIFQGSKKCYVHFVKPITMCVYTKHLNMYKYLAKDPGN